jgi:hypothetical protein
MDQRESPTPVLPPSHNRLEYGLSLDSFHRRQRNAKLSGCSLLSYLYLAYFSQPVPERQLYRHLRSTPCRSIVEIGVGQTTRTRRILDVARRYTTTEAIRYTGIDLFEARPATAPGLKLKEAHQQLHLPGVRTLLVPGDPLSALSRVANSLRETDLIIVGADQDPESLNQAWFYMPRVMHAGAKVFWQQPAADSQGGGAYRVLGKPEVERLAEETGRSLRRAS